MSYGPGYTASKQGVVGFTHSVGVWFVIDYFLNALI